MNTAFLIGLTRGSPGVGSRVFAGGGGVGHLGFLKKIIGFAGFEI